MHRWVGKAVLCVSLLATGPLVLAQHDVHAVLLQPSERKPAPAFRLTSDAGKVTQVSSYRGNVVLLNFWATDCGGCKLEIPWFIELQQSYKDKGFTAVGVAMDISYESLKNAKEAWSLVRPYAATHGLNYPILMGSDATSKAYSLQVYPDTYLIDKSGKVAAAYIGVISKADVEANINRLLAEH